MGQIYPDCCSEYKYSALTYVDVGSPNTFFPR